MMLTNSVTTITSKTTRDPAVDNLPITEAELKNQKKSGIFGLNEEIKLDFEQFMRVYVFKK
jgi:hypothetical protein